MLLLRVVIDFLMFKVDKSCWTYAITHLIKLAFVMQQFWQHALLMKKGSFLSHVDLKCLKQL